MRRDEAFLRLPLYCVSPLLRMPVKAHPIFFHRNISMPSDNFRA